MLSSRFVTLLSALLAASSAVAVTTVDITKRIDKEGLANLAKVDRHRVETLKSNARAKAVARRSGKPLPVRQTSTGVINQVVTYTLDVGVGSPATTYTLLVDTGSSNTWLGADKAYVKTSTSKTTGHTVSVSYGSGSFSGTEYTDTVNLGNGLVIANQSIGVASRSSGFGSGIDGIVGIGPVALTQGTVASTTTVPTVTDNLARLGVVPADEVGLSYAPPGLNGGAGSLSFGGPDTTKFTGTLTYSAITTTSPATEYVGVNAAFTYGTTSLQTSTAGIIDSGTTLIYIPTPAYKKYVTGTGATLDATTGLLKVTATQFAALKSFIITIGGKTYTLTPDAQLFPRSLNTDIGGTASGYYLIVSDWGASAGAGLDFIVGYAFLERFYHTYDATNKRVSLATTSWTNSTVNQVA